MRATIRASILALIHPFVCTRPGHSGFNTIRDKGIDSLSNACYCMYRSRGVTKGRRTGINRAIER